MGIICFPSLQRLAEDVSDQLAQEIQKALAGKPAGKRTEVLENTMESETALQNLPRAFLSPFALSWRKVVFATGRDAHSAPECLRDGGKSRGGEKGMLGALLLPGRRHTCMWSHYTHCTDRHA